MALLRDLWNGHSHGISTGPIWPSIEADDFELKPGLIALVQQHQFRGLPSEDPHEHIRIVLEYSNTVKYHGVSQDAIRCRLFTFSLRDDARSWYRSLPSRMFSWDQISDAFLGRYFPIHKQIAARDQILSFAQGSGEGFHDAWERYKDLIRRCPNHGLERWLELQIFYRGLTCDARSFVDLAAGGAITSKTLDGAFMHIENIAFHQFQFNEKTSSELLVCRPQVAIPQLLHHNQRPEPYASCDNIELSRVLFAADDAIIIDTRMVAQMETIVQDSVILMDDSFMCEPEFQSVEFDIEEPSLVDIDDALLEIEMEKFTFEYVSSSDSASFEPEMETFMIDDDEADSYVMKPSSTTTTTDIVPQENSTTTHPMIFPAKVVLKLLKHLRYDFNFLHKACRTIHIAYATCKSLLKFVHDTFYCYASIIGYSIDDLAGVSPITFARFRFKCYSRLPSVPTQLQDEHVRVDIPFDPGGFTSW